MRRLSLFVAVFLTGITLVSQSSQAETRSFLSAQDSRQLVQAIDSICGDTWCAGDLNYLFDKLECGPDACFFDVRAEIRNTTNDGQLTSRDSRPFRCQLNGFASRSDLVDESGFRLTYSAKLYEAMGECLYYQLGPAHPVVYLPEVKSCRSSIEQKPYYQSAAHSVYAEVFYELNAVDAAVQTLSDLVSSYSKTDSSCSLTYYMAFRDRVQCQSINSKALCSLPASEGQFLIVKDYVDSAAVLYFKDAAKVTPVLGQVGTKGVTTKLADSALCYSDLLNLNGTQPVAQPFAASDHRSYFVSTKNLRLSQDARLNASLLVNSVVRNLSRSAAKTCTYQEKTITLDNSACQKIGGRDVCLVSSENSGGYFIVSKDNAAGAFVTFVRFD